MRSRSGASHRLSPLGCAVVLVGVTVVPGAVRAEPGAPLDLDWVAPGECPSAESVERDVELKLGRGVTRVQPLVARARVRNEAAGSWVLELHTVQDGAVGARRVEGKSCEAVSEAAVMILALALNPELGTSVPGDSDTRSAPIATRAVNPAPSARPPSSRPAAAPTGSNRSTSEQASRSSGIAFVEGAIHFGALAVARPLAGAGLSVELGRGNITAAGDYGFAQVTYAPSRREGVSLSLATGHVTGCYTLVAVGPLAAAPCAGVAVTHAWGRGVGVDRPEHDSLLWMSGELGSLLSFRLRDLRLRFTAAALVPAARPGAYLGGVGEVAAPAPVQARFAAGLGVVSW